MSARKTDKILDSRTIAARALGRILTSGEQLEATLSADKHYRGLETRDRGFVRLLVSAYFRQKGQIDTVVDGLLSRTPPDFVLNALRIGAVQLLILGTADHAAVGETVELLKSHKK